MGTFHSLTGRSCARDGMESAYIAHIGEVSGEEVLLQKMSVLPDLLDCMSLGVGSIVNYFGILSNITTSMYRK